MIDMYQEGLFILNEINYLFLNIRCRDTHKQGLKPNNWVFCDRFLFIREQDH
jgi:hypothetical protein